MALVESSSDLEVGEKCPEFKLENYNEEKVGLEDLNNYDGVLIVFMCNHCPYVKSQLEELKKLDEEFSSIAVVGINPNVETNPDDSQEKMKKFVKQNEIDFHYLMDPEQKVAEAYNAKCTPDPFLLDWRHRLYYHGRLNDKTSPDDNLEDREIREIIQDMLKRRKPPEKSKPSTGCSIKWKEENNNELHS